MRCVIDDTGDVVGLRTKIEKERGAGTGIRERNGLIGVGMERV